MEVKGGKKVISPVRQKLASTGCLHLCLAAGESPTRLPTLWSLATHACPPCSRSVLSTYAPARLEETSVQFRQSWTGVRELMLPGDHIWTWLKKGSKRWVSSASKVLMTSRQRWRCDVSSGLALAVLWPTGIDPVASSSVLRDQTTPWAVAMWALSPLSLTTEVSFPLLTSILQQLASSGGACTNIPLFL